MSTKYKIRDQQQLYFLTFAVVRWVDVFTRREYKDLLLESLRYCQQHKGLELYAYVIMPNHVHLIAGVAEGGNLSGVMRDLKKFTSSAILKAIRENPQESRREWMLWLFRSEGQHNPNNTHYQFWQQDNHPIELSTNEMLQQRMDYLHYNPVEAGFVSSPEDYLYSSARDYCGEKGLLELVLVE
jgi:putative transposase